MARQRTKQPIEENEEVWDAIARIREHALICSANLWGLPGSVLEEEERPFRVDFLMMAMIYFFATLKTEDVHDAFFLPGGMGSWSSKVLRTSRTANPDAAFAPYWVTPPCFVKVEPPAN